MGIKLADRVDVVRKARIDIERVLNRYRLTIPEVIGVSPSERDIDEEIWESIRPDYERIQKKVFAETYPDLWKKVRRRRR